MARKLTNKQLAVLGVLRRGDEMTADDIAEIVSKETPCGVCGGSGEGDRECWSARTGKRENVCGKCYGRGHAYFPYGYAYQALQRLMAEGLVTRRCKRDEWGDELALHIYRAAEQPQSDDPLEQLWQLEVQR